MTGEGKRIARTRLLKRLGLIGAGTTTVILIVLLIISLLPRGKAAFSIRIDNPSSKDDYTMSISKDGKPTNYVKADPLERAVPSTAQKVEEYLHAVDTSATGLYGQQNFVRTYDVIEGGESVTKTDDLALIYTVYLTNTSETDTVNVRYIVNVDGYRAPDNRTTASELLTYVRILMQTEVVGDSSSLKNIYYGNRRTNAADAPYPTEKGTFEEDGREPISTTDDTEFRLRRVITSSFSSAGNDGYCVSFNNYDSSHKDIVNHPEYSVISIHPGEVMRCTFACYFENDDVDCVGDAPQNSYMLLSLHFGN